MNFLGRRSHLNFFHSFLHVNSLFRSKPKIPICRYTELSIWLRPTAAHLAAVRAEWRRSGARSVDRRRIWPACAHIGWGASAPGDSRWVLAWSRGSDIAWPPRDRAPAWRRRPGREWHSRRAGQTPTRAVQYGIERDTCCPYARTACPIAPSTAIKPSLYAAP